MKDNRNRYLGIVCIMVSLLLVSCGGNHEKEAPNTQEEIVADEATEDISSASQPEDTYERPERVRVENPSFSYYFAQGEPKVGEQTVTLKKTGEESNGIIDDEEWFLKNELNRPGIPYSDDKYTYSVEGKNGTEILQVTENDTNHVIADLDFSDYIYGEDIVPEDIDFVAQKIRYAKIQDDVLYVSTGHNTYASSCPQTAYITAISLEDFRVIWKSQPLVCNSYNFEIVDGTIISGYGFTEEADYLYLLDAKTGNVWEKFPLKTKADYMIRKKDTLFVREYNTNATYEICYLNKQQSNAGKVDEILEQSLSREEIPDEKANQNLDRYLEGTEKEYHLPGTDIYYRMSVIEAAAGTRFYALLKSRDNGNHWYVVSDMPFGDSGGGSVEFSFLNEALGFAALSHNGGDNATLYVTQNGGKSYHSVEISDSPVVTLGDGTTYQPYDFPGMPHLEQDKLMLLVGQGADGDYNGGDGKSLARFMSQDGGATFCFDGYETVDSE